MCVCVCVCVCVLREWLVKSAMLVAMAVYTYLRLMVDHGTTALLVLRQKEVDFCISMLRERVHTRTHTDTQTDRGSRHTHTHTE